MAGPKLIKIIKLEILTEKNKFKSGEVERDIALVLSSMLLRYLDFVPSTRRNMNSVNRNKRKHYIGDLNSWKL